MAVVTRQHLSAAPAVVWSRLSGPAALASWVTQHAGFVGAPPAAWVVGDEVVERLRVLGMVHEVRWTVQDVVEGSAVVLDGRAAMGIAILADYRVAPDGEGSALTVAQTLSGGAVMAVKSQLERELAAAQQASLDQLQTALTA